MVLLFWQKKRKKKLIKFNFLGSIFTCLPPFYSFIPLPIVFSRKIGGLFKTMPLFSVVLLWLVLFSFYCGLMGGQLDRWVCGPHATSFLVLIACAEPHSFHFVPRRLHAVRVSQLWVYWRFLFTVFLRFCCCTCFKKYFLILKIYGPCPLFS